jgi:hypothetical protein
MSITIERIQITVTYAPFPSGAGDEVLIAGQAEWRPVGRPDVRPSVTAVDLGARQGDPLQGALVAIQSAAATFIRNRWSDRGEDDSTNTFASLSLSWGYDFPRPDPVAGPLSVQAVGVWYPSGFEPGADVRSRAQSDAVSATVGPGAAVRTHLEAMALDVETRLFAELGLAVA